VTDDRDNARAFWRKLGVPACHHCGDPWVSHRSEHAIEYKCRVVGCNCTEPRPALAKIRTN
jgi:hypothetical protein